MAYVDPSKHETFLQRYCMKGIPKDPQKEILNEIKKWLFFDINPNSNSLVHNIFMFIQKETLHFTWVPGDPSTILLATSFTRKMAESSDSMDLSIFMLKHMIS